MKEILKKWGLLIATSILLVLYVSKGCTNSKLVKLDSKIEAIRTEVKMSSDSINSSIDSLNKITVTHKEMKDEMERIMFDFLIYEDDLDKGKTSLSAIKSKIESND